MYFVYVLQSSKDEKYYVGYTNNIRRRLEEHNNGKVTITMHRKPFRLVYLEGYLHQQDATSREKFFKTGWRRTHLKKVLKNYLGG